MCSCNETSALGQNDYSLQTANLGIANIDSAVTSLTGTNATPVYTAASSGFNGSIIKSIRIKATGPVTKGMVRLFISNSGGSAISLLKEIPIPVTPILDATPTPMPALPLYEMVLNGGLKLEPGYKLLAATQNAQSFNIITEGLDWKYPGTLPNDCCNYIQQKAVTGLGTISAANTIVAVYTAPGSTNGSFVKTVTIKAMGPTSINGMISLYVSSDGSNFTLLQEIVVPETDQSGYEPSFKMVVDLNLNINSGYVIGASTLLAEGFAVTVEANDWTYPIS